DTRELQNHFVERLHEFLSGFGKSVIGWDEIIDSELPEDAVVMSWRGIDGAIAAAARGHRTVLSPAPTFYLDHIQSLAADAPPGRGGVVTARDIYDYEPLPAALAGSRRFVLGLQGNLWTEHVRTEGRVAYMSYPRAAAIAELAWSRPPAGHWQDFSRRLSLHVPRLRQLGIAVAETDKADPRPQAASRPGLVRLEDRELETCSHSIVLALEDDAPVDGERESYLLDIMDPCWIAHDVDLREELSIRASVGQLPFNFEIGPMIADVVVAPPATQWGELNVRLGTCDGQLLAALSLEPAHASAAATVLPPAALALPPNALPSTASLCLRFARHGIDPIWAIDWIELATDFAERPR
ncbi:MAG: family 20 glycosylhydrolase, partial [Woeseiaceae bacterium]